MEISSAEIEPIVRVLKQSGLLEGKEDWVIEELARDIVRAIRSPGLESLVQDIVSKNLARGAFDAVMSCRYGDRPIHRAR